MTCGTGVSLRAVKCRVSEGFQDDAVCDASMRPVDKRACFIGACPTEKSISTIAVKTVPKAAFWRYGSWTEVRREIWMLKAVIWSMCMICSLSLFTISVHYLCSLSMFTINLWQIQTTVFVYDSVDLHNSRSSNVLNKKHKDFLECRNFTFSFANFK